MKKVIVVFSLLVVFAVVLLIAWLRSDPDAPRFKPAQTQPVFKSDTLVSYHRLSSRPFEGGKMWISAWSGTNEYRYFLYDIEHKNILGELFNADAAFMTSDQTKLLCVQRVSWARRPLGDKTLAIIAPLFRGKRSFPRRGADLETFWILDLKRNSAVKIGTAVSHPGLGIDFQLSSDFRYAYNRAAALPGENELFLCDVEKRVLARINVGGWPAAWWDARNILVKEPDDDFVLYDVVTGKSSLLLGASNITAFLEQNRIPDDGSKLNVFFTWNVRENVFYLTDPYKKWQATESFLARIERPEATLKLLSSQFKFEWSDHLDSIGRYYLYSGREAGQASSGVFLRDLRSNTNRVLVAPDDRERFAIPNFYRDGVIYRRSNALWRIDLSGSNCTRLFPPSAD